MGFGCWRVLSLPAQESQRTRLKPLVRISKRLPMKVGQPGVGGSARA